MSAVRAESDEVRETRTPAGNPIHDEAASTVVAKAQDGPTLAFAEGCDTGLQSDGVFEMDRPAHDSL